MTIIYWMCVICVVGWFFNAFEDEKRKQSGLKPRRSNAKAGKLGLKIIKWGLKK